MQVAKFARSLDLAVNEAADVHSQLYLSPGSGMLDHATTRRNRLRSKQKAPDRGPSF
jgi:hypothetical protein